MYKPREKHQVKMLTAQVVDTYQKCNPEFEYKLNMNPKLALTHPSDPSEFNFGYDNVHNDYILRVSESINTPEGRQ